MKRKDLKNKKCSCHFWNLLEKNEIKKLREYKNLRYCPFCGSELVKGYTITIYECTNPEKDYEDFDDDGSATVSKLYYAQKAVKEYVFETRKERSQFWEKVLKKQFKEEAHPTYIETDHYSIMIGTVFAKGNHSQFGLREYKFWNGKEINKGGFNNL